jgi:hypothetical protein
VDETANALSLLGVFAFREELAPPPQAVLGKHTPAMLLIREFSQLVGWKVTGSAQGLQFREHVAPGVGGKT